MHYSLLHAQRHCSLATRCQQTAPTKRPPFASTTAQTNARQSTKPVQTNATQRFAQINRTGTGQQQNQRISAAERINRLR